MGVDGEKKRSHITEINLIPLSLPVCDDMFTLAVVATHSFIMNE